MLQTKQFFLTLLNFKNELIALETYATSLYLQNFFKLPQTTIRRIALSIPHLKKNRCLCVSMCQCAHVCGYSRIGEGVGCPGTGITSSSELPNVYWRLNSGLLQEQCVLLTAELSSRPYLLYLNTWLIPKNSSLGLPSTREEDSATCGSTVGCVHVSIIVGLYYYDCNQKQPSAVVPFSSNLVGPRVAQYLLECYSVPVF